MSSKFYIGNSLSTNEWHYFELENFEISTFIGWSVYVSPALPLKIAQISGTKNTLTNYITKISKFIGGCIETSQASPLKVAYIWETMKA